jgi:hypothetical protein
MSGDVAIAYQIVSDGPFDVVWVPGAVSNVELNWQDEHWAAFIGRISSFCRLTKSVHGLGIEIRAGLHTGECEVVDNKVAGIAVNTGARVAAQAAPGEVLVSETVKDLVAGSGLAFEERGTAELKGVPDEWRPYAVAA